MCILPRMRPGSVSFCRNFWPSPDGRHDDQVDSLSQFLFWWQRENFQFNIPIVAPLALLLLQNPSSLSSKLFQART